MDITMGPAVISISIGLYFRKISITQFLECYLFWGGITEPDATKYHNSANWQIFKSYYEEALLYYIAIQHPWLAKTLQEATRHYTKNETI